MYEKDSATLLHLRRPWPVHCVAGSHGATLDERLDHSQIERIVDKGVDRETDSYSGFAATDLALDLRAHGVRRNPCVRTRDRLLRESDRARCRRTVSMRSSLGDSDVAAR